MMEKKKSALWPLSMFKMVMSFYYRTYIFLSENNNQILEGNLISLNILSLYVHFVVWEIGNNMENIFLLWERLFDFDYKISKACKFANKGKNLKKKEHQDECCCNVLLHGNFNLIYFFLQFLYVCTPCIWNAQSGARFWEWHHSEHPLAWLMGVLNHEFRSNKRNKLYTVYVWISFSRSDTCGI